jgi:hypothetical protein
MMTILEFARKHEAFSEGPDFSLSNCKDMQEVWKKSNADLKIKIATRPGVLTEKELRLFAVFCARQASHLTTDSRILFAIDVAERFANGVATLGELSTVASDEFEASSLYDIYLDSTIYYIRKAAASACDHNPYLSAINSSHLAACALASSVPIGESYSRSYSANWYKARADQSSWLIANTKPNFNCE